jgi:hypothetical protein
MYEIQPDELLAELNGARDDSRITALLKRYRSLNAERDARVIVNDRSAADQDAMPRDLDVRTSAIAVPCAG